MNIELNLVRSTNKNINSLMYFTIRDQREALHGMFNKMVESKINSGIDRDTAIAETKVAFEAVDAIYYEMQQKQKELQDACEKLASTVEVVMDSQQT